MPRFVIEVSEQAYESLADRARQERRPLKDQAAWLLERHLLKAPDGPAPSGAERQEEGYAAAVR